MNHAEVAADLTTLERKLDALAARVEFLAEQARLTARRQEERVELVEDVMPILNDAFRMTTEQLEEVQDYVDLGDLLRLLKRVLRNARNAEALVDQFESLLDLAQTAGPLADDAFAKATDLLETAEHKGYFAFAKGGAGIVDSVVTQVGEEDLDLLRDNVESILEVLRACLQPRPLGLLRGVGLELASARVDSGDTSILSLLRQMRDPEVRRGLVLVLRVLRAIGAQSSGEEQA